ASRYRPADASKRALNNFALQLIRTFRVEIGNQTVAPDWATSMQQEIIEAHRKKFQPIKKDLTEKQENMEGHVKQFRLTHPINHKMQILVDPGHLTEVLNYFREALRDHGINFNGRELWATEERHPSVQKQYASKGKLNDFVEESADASAQVKVLWGPEFEVSLEIEENGNKTQTIVGHVLQGRPPDGRGALRHFSRVFTCALTAAGTAKADTAWSFGISCKLARVSVEALDLTVPLRRSLRVGYRSACGSEGVRSAKVIAGAAKVSAGRAKLMRWRIVAPQMNWAIDRVARRRSAVLFFARATMSISIRCWPSAVKTCPCPRFLKGAQLIIASTCIASACVTASITASIFFSTLDGGAHSHERLPQACRHVVPTCPGRGLVRRLGGKVGRLRHHGRSTSIARSAGISSGASGAGGAGGSGGRARRGCSSGGRSPLLAQGLGLHGLVGAALGLLGAALLLPSSSQGLASLLELLADLLGLGTLLLNLPARQPNLSGRIPHHFGLAGPLDVRRSVELRGGGGQRSGRRRRCQVAEGSLELRTRRQQSGRGSTKLLSMVI
ncbi:unnamed protein product, partial [Prorocentrum cordatum]